MALVAACTSPPPATEATAPAATPPAAAAPAPPPPPYYVYVTNETGGDLSVINPISRTVVATIPLGKRPRGIKASPDGTQLFAALSGSPIAGPGVDESNFRPPTRPPMASASSTPTARKLLRVVNGGSDPEQLAVSATAPAPSSPTRTLPPPPSWTVVGAHCRDPADGSEPEGVTMSPDGRLVYVTSEGESRVTAIDATANRVLTHFDVGARPRASAFSPDGAHAYVTSENGGTVSVVDTAKQRS